MFRGFYLTVEDITSEDSILYTSMSSTHSNLTFYFRNDEDTSKLNLVLGRNYGQSINIFSQQSGTERRQPFIRIKVKT